jgi:very-short-patch-repair endonuclease
MKDDNPRLRRFARQMRKEPTPAEQALWQLLRNRRLTGFKFRRQHPLSKHIIDCYCPAARLVIELDGDSHATDGGKRSDAERTRFLEARGVLVLRFWNTQVAEDPDAVLERIVSACAARAKQRPEQKEPENGGRAG